MVHCREGCAPKEALRHALADAEKSFKGLRRRPPKEKYEIPFSSMMFVSATGDGFEALWFGDCAALSCAPAKASRSSARRSTSARPKRAASSSWPRPRGWRRWATSRAQRYCLICAPRGTRRTRAPAAGCSRPIRAPRSRGPSAHRRAHGQPAVAMHRRIPGAGQRLRRFRCARSG